MNQWTLADWLAHAERVHPVGIDMGLDRVRRVAQRLDVLTPAPHNVVIAGTNGKGSTAIYLEALLLASGRRVGTTLSPHLHRFNERVRVDGAPVTDDLLCDAFVTIERARGEITLTYFEFGVLAALWAFRHAEVDVTVLEVGLGGRLDAVNVVDGSVTVITSIGIDHVGYLGADRESIGAEKAGILRAGVPCVYGEASIPSSVENAVDALRSRLLQFDVDFHVCSSRGGWHFDGHRDADCVAYRDLALPSVALSNAATALQAFLLLEPAAPIAEYVAAASSARLPARFERFEHHGVPTIVDVAHNPHGAAFLGKQLQREACGGRTIAVAGFLQDKDAAGIVAALAGTVNEWMFVATQGPRGQSAAQSSIKAAMTTRASASEGRLIDVFDTHAKRLTEHDRIVVFGSFDLAQRAREVLLGGTSEGD